MWKIIKRDWEGYDENNDTAGHNQTIHVQCLAQFQPTTNKTTVIIMIIIEIIILSSITFTNKKMVSIPSLLNSAWLSWSS